MTSKPTIIQLIDRLEEYLSQLQELRKHSFREFEKDWKIYQLVDHSLHLAIECLIDIGKTLLIEKKLKKPQTYKEVFDILNKNKIISSELTEELKDLVEFRNSLIHDYLFLDLEDIYDVSQNKLKVFSEFLEAVRKILK